MMIDFQRIERLLMRHFGLEQESWPPLHLNTINYIIVLNGPG